MVPAVRWSKICAPHAGLVKSGRALFAWTLSVDGMDGLFLGPSFLLVFSYFFGVPLYVLHGPTCHSVCLILSLCARRLCRFICMEGRGNHGLLTELGRRNQLLWRQGFAAAVKRLARGNHPGALF
jgi:hypothetical protein